MAGTRKFAQVIDMLGHEIKNILSHKVAGDPGSPVEAQSWYDTVAKRFKVRTDAATKTLAYTDEISAGATFDDPIASAVGDTIDEGVDTDSARADHRHGREAFAAPVALTAFGVSTATGTATTVVHSDHVHGSPAHDASAHSAIKLSDLAVPTANISLNSNKLTAVTDGTADSDAATVGQMNALLAGLAWKDPVRVATTANGTLATAFENGDTVDGIALATGDRILIKDQSAGAENGIYTVNASGAPTRATDADSNTDLQGAAVMVLLGTANADTAWYTATDAITVNTTAIVWSPFPGFAALVAGAGLVKTGNTVDVGAGDGIVVNANDVAADWTKAARHKEFLLGDGVATTFPLTHNLGRKLVKVVVSDTVDDSEWEVGVVFTSTTVVTLDFDAVVPTTDQFSVLVLG